MKNHFLRNFFSLFFLFLFFNSCISPKSTNANVTSKAMRHLEGKWIIENVVINRFNENSNNISNMSFLDAENWITSQGKFFDFRKDYVLSNIIEYHNYPVILYYTNDQEFQLLKFYFDLDSRDESFTIEYSLNESELIFNIDKTLRVYLKRF